MSAIFLVVLSGAQSGAVAQLGERLLCKQDVVGSIPSGSTTSLEEVSSRGEKKSFVKRFVVSN